jgi:hypothetical protein
VGRNCLRLIFHWWAGAKSAISIETHNLCKQSELRIYFSALIIGKPFIAKSMLTGGIVGARVGDEKLLSEITIPEHFPAAYHKFY